MYLLFELTTWHGLAKLHLHTELTVQALESSTTQLGIAFHKFQSTTCAEFVTCHLSSEEAAWGCWKAAKAKLQPTAPKLKSKGKELESKGKKKVSSMLWAFGLSNCKTHVLPDYVKTIREFGTMDGYSTQNMSSLFKVKFWVEVTVIHWLMIHHPPMIHFWYINNSLKNADFSMKQIFLNTSASSLFIIKISRV